MNSPAFIKIQPRQAVGLALAPGLVAMGLVWLDALEPGMASYLPFWKRLGALAPWTLFYTYLYSAVGLVGLLLVWRGRARLDSARWLLPRAAAIGAGLLALNGLFQTPPDWRMVVIGPFVAGPFAAVIARAYCFLSGASWGRPSRP